MKPRSILSLAALLLLLSFAGPARAAFLYEVQVDEDGNGFLINQTTGNRTTLEFTVNPLEYTLKDQGTELTVSPGDILIPEITGGGGGDSDLIRFPTSGHTLQFFSELTPGLGAEPRPDFADVVALPAHPGAKVVDQEAGNAENTIDFTTYEPMNAGDPGFITGGVKYTIISDRVIPEPSALTLLGIGVLGLLGFARRRHRPDA